MRYAAETRFLRVDPQHPEADIIARAADVIRAGGLVAFPTETVYGLGANATDSAAVERIFSAKERPNADPLIVHLASVDQLPSVALELPPIAQELTALWPGALTMVLKRSPNIPPNVSAGLATVGVRIPSHPVAHALIEAAGVPIAAPSANRFSRPSATTAEHVREDLQGHVDLILDGGAATFGIESTIVDVTSDPPRILRYGAIQPERFEALGFVTGDQFEMTDDNQAKPAPGMMLKHYSPRARLMFYGDGSPETLRQMQTDARIFTSEGVRVGVLVPDANADLFKNIPAITVSLGADLEQVAAHLFAAMRELDRLHVEVILARGYERTGIGAALWERLLRAAEGQIVEVRKK
ncbi:MAG TPA: L-threonylcarbamoyladenylate synthase [Phototrophicaceae bacterium]|nr:L-threonylcarbamoyladenylate synthase [Phototrophicaceae bacterium]